MKLELEKSREQQQASPTYGYHSETNDLGSANPLVQSQHRLEYSLSDAVPQTAVMHLQAADEMEQTPDDDEEEDEEDEEEEEENEEDDEDEEDSSSFLSDSSTQSLANSDSEDEDDEDEEKKSKTFQGDMTTPSVSLTDVVPLSSLLCYSNGSVAHDHHMSGSTYLMNSSSAEYYQLGSSSAVSNGQTSGPSEPYGEGLAFQDPVTTNNGNTAQGPFNMSAGQYTDYSNQTEEQYTANQHFTLTNGAPAAPLTCYTSDQEEKGLSKAAFVEQPDTQNQTQYKNYLNNSTQGSYSSSCMTAEQPQQESGVNGHSDLSLLGNSTNNLPLPDHCPEVTAI